MVVNMPAGLKMSWARPPTCPPTSAYSSSCCPRRSAILLSNICSCSYRRLCCPAINSGLFGYLCRPRASSQRRITMLSTSSGEGGGGSGSCSCSRSRSCSYSCCNISLIQVSISRLFSSHSSAASRRRTIHYIIWYSIIVFWHH